MMKSAMSLQENDIGNGNEPVHVLMASTPTASLALHHPLAKFHSKWQRDYIAKRRKAYSETNDSETASGSNTTTNRNSSSNNNNNNKEHPTKTEFTPSIWDGVSKVEKALIMCCEPKELENEDENSSTTSDGGALEMDKEVRFAGILARECHTMATRALALAILEQTLEQYKLEQQEKAIQEMMMMMQDDDDDDDNSDHENSGDQSASEEEEEEEGDESDNDNEDTESNDQGKRRKSPRLRQKQPKSRRSKRPRQEPRNVEQEISDPKSTNDEHWGRLEQFFAVGGLKILNRWLIEATKNDEDVMTRAKAPSVRGSNAKQQPQQLTQLQISSSSSPPSTRPLILPILRFLKDIPFDKKLVMDSKINKQIKSLEKMVLAIQEAQSSGTHLPQDLQNWTTEATSTDSEALDRVKEAIDAVKKSWGAKASSDIEHFADPLEMLKDKLRERLDILLEYEAGTAVRPEWLEGSDDLLKKEVTIGTKSKQDRTQELAAKERQAEGEAMRKRLQDAQDEHRKNLVKLRELRKQQQQQQQQQDSLPSNRKRKRSGKEVRWKDGMTTKANRNRKLLEEVFVFEKNNPAHHDVNVFEGMSETTDPEQQESVAS